MPCGDLITHDLQWEELLALPDGARCSVCGDVAGLRTRRPVCVLSVGSRLEHHVLPFMACFECYEIGTEHLSAR